MIRWLSLKKETPKTPTKNSQGDNFLSLAAHELRSPLSIIKWYTEMLLDGDGGPLTPDQTKYLKTIETSNQRAIDLVRSLLNVSRLELGTFCVNPSQQDLSLLIKQVITECKASAGDKGLVFETDEIISTPPLPLDKQMTLVILRNLMSNAIAFSKEGGHIIVKASMCRDGDTIDSYTLTKDSVVITIVDTGIGIPEEDKPSVYHKLFKGSNVTEADSTGSGFGLYIVKTILGHTGGDVWFTSEKGKGTTFFLSFPMTGMQAREGKTTLD
jgi:signal transduction histidine kinase